MIHHNIEVPSINSIGNQQSMFSVNFATTIHHLFRKGSRIGAFWQVHILNHHLVFYDC